MVHFRPGSQAWQLITLLSFAGEFPYQSLSLLGSERVYRALVHKLTTPQTFRNSQTGTEFTCRLLTVSGKGSGKPSGYTRALFPYWNGLGRMCTDITWMHSGTTGFRGTPLTESGTIGWRKRWLSVCALGLK